MSDSAKTSASSAVTPTAELVFATLGPSGSNHQFVTERYIALHSLPARVELVLDFDIALDLLLARRVDHIVQVAVHPATASTTARHYKRVFVIDAFVSSSRPLGVISRKDVARPRSLGLQPATREYVDTSHWDEFVSETSIASVAAGLLDGRFDSGIAALELAEQYPDLLRVDKEIGAIDDAWLVYGVEPVTNGGIVAWLNSPAAALFRRELEAKR